MTRTQWLKYHSIYERKAFRITRTALRDSINVNWDNLTPDTYQVAIPLNISLDVIKEGYTELYFKIGLLHGKRIGYELNREIKRDQETKAFTLGTFTELFRNALANYVERIAIGRIRSIQGTLAQYLVNQFGLGLTEGKTVREIATDMQNLVDSREFYRWQALRIARTETTAAANYGAMVSAGNSGVEIQKEWISARDDRTRRKPRDKYDHLVMDGIRVEEYQEFNVQGDFLMFPGDPEGVSSDVINCRCTLGYVPKRDANGRLIYK